MSSFVNTTTLDVLRSANDPLHQSAPWVLLTEAEADAAMAIPKRYREWSGSAVVEADQATKDAIDAQILADARDAEAERLDQVEDVLRAFALAVLDEVNLLRAEHALAPRTIAQMKTAVRNKLGN